MTIRRRRSTYRILSGFTLVELLVVIAIIGILAGMLLPALMSARKSAQAIQCVSNLKNNMLAMTMYAHDNKDAYPTFIYDRLLTGDDVFYSWGYWLTRLGYTGRGSVLICPSAPPDAITEADPGLYWIYATPAGTRKDSGSSGLARHGAFYSSYIASEHEYYGLGGSRVQFPSDTILLMDTAAKGNQSGIGANPQCAFGSLCDTDSDATAFPHARHNNKMHFAFMDGHAQALGTGDYAPTLGRMWRSSGSTALNDATYYSQNFSKVTLDWVP